MTLDLIRALAALAIMAYASAMDIKTFRASPEDRKEGRVPNKLWLGAAGVALLLLAADASTSGPGVLLGAAVSFGVMAAGGFLMWYREKIGGADAKALMVLGLLFPWWFFPLLFYLGLIVGSGLSAFALVFRFRGAGDLAGAVRKAKVPFIPVIALAAALAVLARFAFLGA